MNSTFYTARENRVPASKKFLKSILEKDGENDVVQTINFDYISREIAKVPEGLSAARINEDNSDNTGVYNVYIGLKNLAIAKYTLERHDIMTESQRKAFYNFHQELRLTKQDKMTQTTMGDCFSKK